MVKIKKFLRILFSKNGLTLPQILNLALYKFSPKKPILNYDPITLIIYLTDRCNYQCPFCPHHTKLPNEKFPYLHHPVEDFTLEKFKQILDLLPKTIMITFAGVGEPLLHPQVLDMADYATSKNMYSQLITNGSLLNDEKIERILNNPNFYLVSISLNATNPEEYAQAFDGRKEIFEKVVSNIKNLVAKKNQKKHPLLEIAVSFVIHKKNIAQAKSFVEFSEKLGVDRVTFLNLIDFGISGFEKENQLYQNDPEVKKYFEELKSFVRGRKIKVDLPVLFSERIEKKCQWFFKNISIDGAGNVGGCGRVMNPQPEYGNLFKEGKNVWNNSYFQKMRSIFLSRNEKLPECCRNCVENQC
jgi:radical SAM protein with 4Fe4S-binding SPASM domain